MSSAAIVGPTGLRREEIEREARVVLDKFQIGSLPIDPVEIANKEGIKVLNAKFSDPNVSGLIARRSGDCQILVEHNDSPTRKRFTIAHELAHYFLHLKMDGEIVDSAVDLQRANGEDASRNLMEVEANRFAAALLMPEDHVRKVWATIRNVDELAVLFRVSREAMAIRLTTLKLA